MPHEHTATRPQTAAQEQPERAKRLSLLNIREVLEHSIVESAGMRSHLIYFANNGELRFAYNQKGQLLEFSAHNVYVDRSDPQHYWVGQMR